MDIILLGAGGHAKDLIANIEDMNAASGKGKKISIIGCVDDTGRADSGLKKLGYEIFKSADVLSKRGFRSVAVVTAVGDPLNKIRFIEKVKKYNPKFANIIHPSSLISRSAVLGRGITVFAHSAISSFCRIGDHVSINFLCSVSHDSIIGEYSTLCPGVNVSGRVTIGECSLMGVKSSCSNKLSLGPWCVIGAGTLVVKDVPANAIAAGVPHKILGKREKDKPVL